MFTIRPATEDDIPALAHLHVQGWKGAYEALLDHPDFKVSSLEDRIKQWKDWIGHDDSGTKMAFVADGSAAGFVSYGRLKTPPPGMSPIRPLYAAEIYGLYLLPDYYRQGLGTRLLCEAAQDLKTMKHSSLCLWTVETNKRAMAFYKARGGERCGKHMIELGPHRVKDICFGWRDTKGLIDP